MGDIFISYKYIIEIYNMPEVNIPAAPFVLPVQSYKDITAKSGAPIMIGGASGTRGG